MASMVLLLSIERIQQGAEEGFNQSISGVDAIIGPRSSSLELVLYTVFHLGRPTNNITTKTINWPPYKSNSATLQCFLTKGMKYRSKEPHEIEQAWKWIEKIEQQESCTELENFLQRK